MLPNEAPIARDAQVDVPGLGTITGLRFATTCQYLGIPYGEIPGRFRRSVLVDKWDGAQWDGTKLGPYCPQPPRDFYPIPSPSRPWLEAPAVDEFQCLNLNISVPKLPAEAAPAGGLPVMVFLHGGAFAYASGAAPVYDGRVLADASRTALARPTIIVTLNYRLGAFGFLAGGDLQHYAGTVGETGAGNYGVWDQVVALRWVQKHIAAFGGDPRRVTLFGQSAGSVSVHCHLMRGEPLFSAAILQSGLVRLCGALSVEEHQVIFEKMLRQLGISLDQSPEDRVRSLLAVSPDALTLALVPVFPVPVVTMALCDDKALLPQGIPKAADYYDAFQAPAWCPRIMVGDCRSETIIWNKGWANLSEQGALAPGADLAEPAAPLVLKRMAAFLGEAKAQAIAAHYGLTADLSPRETFDTLERMTTHGMYSLPIYFGTQSVAQSSPATVYAWHFDVPSPFANAWHGRAHHSFDNVLLWGILRDLLPETHQKAGALMAEAWIKFANGEQPWEAFAEKARWMVFSPSGARLASRAEDSSWDYAIWDELHRKGLVADVANLSDELCLQLEKLVTP